MQGKDIKDVDMNELVKKLFQGEDGNPDAHISKKFKNSPNENPLSDSENWALKDQKKVTDQLKKKRNHIKGE